MVKGTEVAQQEQQVYLSGGLVPRTRAQVAIDDRGFTLGDGLFETLAVRQGQALHLNEHLQRLANSAEQLFIPLPFPLAVMAQQLSELLLVNNVQEGSARITLSRGAGARGLTLPERPQPTLLITTAASLLPLCPATKRAILVTGTRRNDWSPLSRLKSTNGYLDNILALEEAERRGAEEAILLNTQGKAVCGTVGNLFLLRDGNLLTPPVDDGLLPGIGRQKIIEALGAKELSLCPEDLWSAQGLLITNSMGVTVIQTLDDQETQSKQGLAIAEKMQRLILGLT